MLAYGGIYMLVSFMGQSVFGLRDEKGKYLLRPYPGVYEHLFPSKNGTVAGVKACTDTK